MEFTSIAPQVRGLIYIKSLLIALLALFFAACDGDDTKPGTKTFTVTFNLNNDRPNATQTVEAGKTVAKPNDPTREGYIFLGWFTDDETFQNAFDFENTPIRADIDLYAKWSVLTYTVRFTLNGGLPSIDPQTVEDGQKANKPPNDPRREGYTFEGWFTDPDFQNEFSFDTPIKAITTLYARWEVVIHTVAFQLNGGRPDLASQNVEDGKAAQQPADPTRDSYTFEGWFTDTSLQNEFSFDTPITGETILYAKWEKIPKFLIPDKNFIRRLQELTVLQDAFDDEDSLLIKHPEVTRLTTLSIGSKSITDLKGIEYFTSLTILFCQNNQLKTLELSQNTALTTLLCQNNQLKTLDLSQNTVLKKLECNDNQLASLKLPQTASMTELICFNNKLDNLNLSKNTALTDLTCNNNLLQSLDVSQNTALTRLACSDNNLDNLDVSKNTALKALYCANNQLESLTLFQNPSLRALYCLGNSLTELDMRGMRSLPDNTVTIGASAMSNPLEILKVHEDLKDHPEIKKAKTTRGDALVIETYSAEAGSTDYTLVCADYDPNDGDAGSCKKAAP